MALAATAIDFDETTAKLIAPGEKISPPAADLGDIAVTPYLNVQNLTDATGKYGATIR